MFFVDFESFISKLKKCRLCEERFGYVPNPVVWGEKNSKIVQISQAPSRSVHESSCPFTDQSGKTLKYEWYKISDDEFYTKSNFYITSLAHCYPGKNKSGGDNPPPKCCYKKWVIKELELIENELYIIIGAKAASQIFPNEKFEELVFKDNILNGKKAIVLPHPSPLNKSWIKNHPEFLEKRIIEVRTTIYKILGKKEDEK